MKRRLGWLAAVSVLFAAAFCAGARAAATAYNATLQADGKALGTAAGTLDVSRAADGRLHWSLTGGQFTAAEVPHATVHIEGEALSGSGSTSATTTATLKEFNVVVSQSTGVDVTYRFRVTAALDGDTVRAVEIHQMK